MKLFQAFTTAGKGRLNVLKTKVDILLDKEINPTGGNMKIDAIWDTGATNTVISLDIAKQMSLVPIGIVSVSTANGIAKSYKYIITLKLPNDVVINDIEVTSGNLGKGVDMLIGMDIIGLGDFAVTNYNGKTIFSYRYPSCEVIDYCKEATKINNKKIEKEIRRNKELIKQHGNEKCPCGSGRKYRYCCGKEELKRLNSQLSEKELVM